MRRRARIVLHSAGSVQHDPHPPPRASQWGGIVVRLVTGVLALAAWWVVGSGEVVAAGVLPSPASVADAALALVPLGPFLEAVAVSTIRVLLGFALGAAAGILLVSVSGWPARVAEAVRAVPSIAWLPLVVLYSGVTAPVQLGFVAIASMFAVLSRVARPVEAQALVSGLRRAMARSWAFVVAAEFLGASGGIGSMLRNSQGDDRTDRVFVILLVAAALTGVSDGVIRAAGWVTRERSRARRPARTGR